MALSPRPLRGALRGARPRLAVLRELFFESDGLARFNRHLGVFGHTASCYAHVNGGAASAAIGADGGAGTGARGGEGVAMIDRGYLSAAIGAAAEQGCEPGMVRSTCAPLSGCASADPSAGPRPFAFCARHRRRSRSRFIW